MDFFGCPVFNILLDPPYWHHSSLKSHMDNLFLIVLDQGHADYCKKYYGPLKDVERAYMLGPVKELKSYEEKEIDILFTGTFNYEYLDLKKTEKKIFSVCGSEDISRKLFEQLIIFRMEHPKMSALQSMMFILKKNNIRYTDDIFKWLMNVLGTYSDLYIQAYNRKKIITSLVDAGIAIHVAGSGWENLYPLCPDNLIITGSVDFSQTVDLIANSKMVLNIMAWEDGIHDRVLSTMKNGSICITNSNSYIDAHFQDGENILLFDLEKLDMLPAKINTLLNNQTKAKSIAYAGYLKVCSDFTWESFVKKYILAKVNSF